MKLKVIKDDSLLKVDKALERFADRLNFLNEEVKIEESLKSIGIERDSYEKFKELHKNVVSNLRAQIKNDLPKFNLSEETFEEICSKLCQKVITKVPEKEKGGGKLCPQRSPLQIIKDMEETEKLHKKILKEYKIKKKKDFLKIVDLYRCLRGASKTIEPNTQEFIRAKRLIKAILSGEDLSEHFEKNLRDFKILKTIVRNINRVAPESIDLYFAVDKDGYGHFFSNKPKYSPNSGFWIGDRNSPDTADNIFLTMVPCFFKVVTRTYQDEPILVKMRKDDHSLLDLLFTQVSSGTLRKIQESQSYQIFIDYLKTKYYGNRS